MGVSQKRAPDKACLIEFLSLKPISGHSLRLELVGCLTSRAQGPAPSSGLTMSSKLCFSNWQKEEGRSCRGEAHELGAESSLLNETDETVLLSTQGGDPRAVGLIQHFPNTPPFFLNMKLRKLSECVQLSILDAAYPTHARRADFGRLGCCGALVSG